MITAKSIEFNISDSSFYEIIRIFLKNCNKGLHHLKVANTPFSLVFCENKGTLSLDTKTQWVVEASFDLKKGDDFHIVFRRHASVIQW